jgi:hypothetical protein
MSSYVNISGLSYSKMKFLYDDENLLTNRIDALFNRTLRISSIYKLIQMECLVFVVDVLTTKQFLFLAHLSTQREYTG